MVGLDAFQIETGKRSLFFWGGACVIFRFFWPQKLCGKTKTQCLEASQVVMNKNPGCFGYIYGAEKLTQLLYAWDDFIKHEMRIPIKQPVFHGK